MARVESYKTDYGMSDEWADWMIENHARYDVALAKSSARPDALTVSFRYEEGSTYEVDWATEAEHMTVFARMAEGAGIASVMVLETEDQMEVAAQFLADAPAPRFLLVRVTDGPPAAFKRNLNPAQCRTQFRKAFLGTS